MLRLLELGFFSSFQASLLHRWVLVRISLNCKLSGLNSRLPNCSKLKKAKEPLHGPNAIRKWRRKLLFFFCLLVSIVLK